MIIAIVLIGIAHLRAFVTIYPQTPELSNHSMHSTPSQCQRCQKVILG